MAANTENVKQLIRDQLLSSATLVALVENRVYGAHLQDPDAGTVPMPLLVVSMGGGAVGYASDPWVEDFELWAYSKISGDEAAEVYTAAFSALQGERLTSTAFSTAGYARELTRPTEGYNDKIRAWYRRARWVANGAG
jgi:hypothetical protein